MILSILFPEKCSAIWKSIFTRVLENYARKIPQTSGRKRACAGESVLPPRKQQHVSCAEHTHKRVGRELTRRSEAREWIFVAAAAAAEKKEEDEERVSSQKRKRRERFGPADGSNQHSSLITPRLPARLHASSRARRCCTTFLPIFFIHALSILISPRGSGLAEYPGILTAARSIHFNLAAPAHVYHT